jgi:putative MATE family efflux protein
MASAFITGLSAGVQAMAARRKGEGRVSETALALNGGLLLGLALALPWSLLLVLHADSLFPFLVDDPAVVEQGVPYLRMRLLAMTAMAMNFAFRGYWNGVSRSRLYMRTLILMHSCNIVLNWVLIFGKLGLPALGCTGAGLGTAISTYLGTGYYLYLGFRHARPAGFLRGCPDRRTLTTMLRLSVPAGVQHSLFAAGMTTFFWILGQVGTEELAASNVLVHLLLVAVLPGVGFGLAAASLAGQALGRGDPADATRWGWDVSRLAVVVVAVIAVPGALFPKLLLGAFIHDPVTLGLATLPLRILALGMAVDTLGTVLLNALLGVGYTRMVMTVSVTLQWGLFLPAAYLMGPVLGWGMLAVWLGQVVYRSIQAAAFAMVWHRGGWRQVEV